MLPRPFTDLARTNVIEVVSVGVCRIARLDRTSQVQAIPVVRFHVKK